MKQTRNLIGIAFTCLFFAACQKDSRYTPANQLAKNNETSSASSRSHPKNEEGPGWVYTLSNSPGSNEVLAYHRAADGQLTFNAAYATGGTGTGGGLGNQGAVILADHGDVVLAVNAGSNSISSLKITGNGLNLKSTVSSGGLQPVSIAAYHDLVYVLNAGGNGSISGFRLMNNDKLVPISNSSRPLSVAATTGPAQISFVQDGRALVITEKATNTITTYTINEMGLPGVIHTMSSASPTPFGFATGNAGIIFVSEAVGGAPGASVLSSYNIGGDGHIALVDGSVGAGQTAACWVVVTKNGQFAYATNTGSNNLTTFGVNVFSGDINVNNAISATTPAGPIDAALTDNSKFLYVLNAGGHSISVFAVADDGGLSDVQTVSGILAGATGLAAK
jgi:6-phosphogluconolactonase